MTAAGDLGELTTQVETLRRLGYARIAGMSDAASTRLLEPPRARVGDTPAAAASDIPFVVVPSPQRYGSDLPLHDAASRLGPSCSDRHR